MSKDLALFEKSLSIGSLGAYTHWVNQLPMLSAEEEHELALRLKNDGDIEAARKLVLSHLRAVVKIARGYNGYGLQQADLIQEGNIGLMKAVKRFNPEAGVRLISYALHWIKAEIHEFVIKNWRIVKIATTKAQRKLFFNLRKLSQSNRLSETDVKMVAEELKVSDKDVRVMAQRLYSFDEAFDSPGTLDDNDNNWSSPANYLEDHSANPIQILEADNWNKAVKTKLYEAITKLDERGRDILQQRWLTDKKTTLQVLAKKYGVSIERIRQIEQSALLQLKSEIAGK